MRRGAALARVAVPVDVAPPRALQAARPIAVPVDLPLVQAVRPIAVPVEPSPVQAARPIAAPNDLPPVRHAPRSQCTAWL